MKRILCALFFLQILFVHAQTKLASHKLELRKSEIHFQIMNAVDPARQDVYVFAADRETIHAHRYNSALFLTDSLSLERPERKYELMAGYSISSDGVPEVYWSDIDMQKMMAVRYPFDKKPSSIITYDFKHATETVLGSFSGNNSFYFITISDTEPELNIYAFHDGKHEKRTIDFADYKFMDGLSGTRTLKFIVNKDPLKLIDNRVLNPLFVGTSESKMYANGNHLVLTFDQNPSLTQVFDINLDSYQMAAKSIAQPLTQNVRDGNSFVNNGKLYQVSRNNNTLVLAATDLQSGTRTKSYTMMAGQDYAFKNSPLMSQTGNLLPRQLKNTEKFLNRLAESELGVSVYKAPDYTLVTVGGVRFVPSTGSTLLGVAAGVGVVLAGGYDSPDIEIENDRLQSIYFESLFDDNFEHRTIEQSRLAGDYIGQFLAEHDEVSLENVFKFKDYFIMGYYDSKAKEYVMRKFVDETFFGRF
ncbi:MAG TPA: hypothetical protein VF581_05665 [Flavobacterium sp.]